MRNNFSSTLVKLALADPSLLLLTGDHGYALFDEFRRACPQQYINAGIAEQNMVGMAAGLARSGFRPFVYGLSAFIPIRVLEQIKLDVAHDQLPVVFIGDGAGIVYSHLGTSHQSTEDIACARAIPNLSVYSPADRFEIIACMHEAYDSKSSVYLRLGKADRGDVYSTTPKIKIGQLIKVKTGQSRKLSFIATGSMVKMAMNIGNEFFPDATVWSAPFIKPINKTQVASICKESDLLVTMEEHSEFGGLGSLIAEIASELSPVKILRVAVQDRFSQLCGDYEYLLKEHSLDKISIKNRIVETLGIGF